MPNSAEQLAEQMQEAFFKRLASPRSLLDLLDLVSGAFFFVKDEHSRIIWVSHAKGERLGIPDPTEFVGATDYDMFPKHVADGMVQDDLTVMRTRIPLLRRTELWFSNDRRLQWSITSKLPLFDATGQAIGVIGFVVNSKTASESSPSSPIDKAIAFVEANQTRLVTVAEIAAAAHLSERQLLRVVKNKLGMSVQKFAMCVRIQAASTALLEPHATVATVAGRFGFCDQSSFTRQFRLYMDTTPADFQRKYRGL